MISKKQLDRLSHFSVEYERRPFRTNVHVYLTNPRYNKGAWWNKFRKKYEHIVLTYDWYTSVQRPGVYTQPDEVDELIDALSEYCT